MRRKFQLFLLFLIILHSSWAYNIFSHVDPKPFSRNAAVAASAAPTISDTTPGTCTIDVIWSCSSCPSTFDGFNVYWQQTGKESQSEKVSYQTTQHTINGLISSQSYSVWVASIIDDVETNSGKETESTEKGVPYDVSGINAETVSDSVIKVSWEKTSNPCPIQGYEVSWTGTAKFDGAAQNGHRETDENTTSIEADNLQPYTTYNFYVSEITTDGIIGNFSESSTVDTDQGAASPPDPVTSVALGPSSAQVDWSLPEAPNGVITGYHISCQILPDEKDDCDVGVGEDVFTYNVTTLLDCGEYTFSVQAINEIGGLGEAGTHSSTTGAGEPSDISGFNYENKTSDSIFLIWDPLTTNCPVTKYDLHVEGKVLWNDNTERFNKDIPVENEYFLLENLTPYSSYNISIRATTKGGTTNYVWQVVDTEQGEAQAPVDLKASTVDSSTVSLSWSPSPAINGELLSYHITCKKQLTDLINVCDELTGDLTYEVPGLDGCAEFIFYVSAVNGYGDGEAANTRSSTANETPGDMGDVTTSAANSTNITVTLVPPDTTCEVLHYDVEGIGVAQWNENITIPYKGILVEKAVGKDTYIIPDVNPYTAYTFNISATTAGGTTNGVPYEETTAEGAPSEPMNFQATALDSRRVRLTWDEPEFQNGDTLRDYYLSYELLGMENEEIALRKTVRTYTLGDDDSEKLLPCQTYNIRLRASNENGNGSAASLRAKIQAEKPNAVKRLKCNAVGPNSAELTWNVDRTTCRIKYYTISLNGNIEWGGTSKTSVNETNIPPNGGSLTLTGLIADTIYDITLQPGNDAGLGEAESCPQIVTESKVPEKPANLSVTDRSKSKLEIKWLAPEMRNGILTSFKITWGDNGEASVDAVNDTSYVYSYSIEDLDDDKIYEIKVYAGNSKGFGLAASENGETEKSHLGAILGTVIPVIVIIIAVALGVWYNKSHKKKKKNTSNSDD